MRLVRPLRLGERAGKQPFADEPHGGVIGKEADGVGSQAATTAATGAAWRTLSST